MFRKIKYNDLKTLRELLVGQKIERITKHRTGWTDFISPEGKVTFYLSNGIILEALESEGCGGCELGWWTVGTDALEGATIMNVGLSETYTLNGVKVGEELNPNIKESQVAIKFFAMTDAGSMDLVVSNGQDNGCYGWGFSFLARTPNDLRVKYL